MSAPCLTKYLTISNLPSKQAARRGVLSVFVAWFTLAPARTKRFTIPRCPAPAAHHNAVAPETKKSI